MRVLAPLLALLLAPAVSSVRTAPSASPARVDCDQIIGQAPTGRAGGRRIVLGIVSAPPARTERAVRVYGMSWPYWHKAGLVIHASRTVVTVSVPRAWRQRAAITWGGTTGIVHSLRFVPCPSPPGVWNAYAGGFYLRSAKACVPLRITVGRRSKVVRFGIGRRC